jgi:Flp pilus assembly protein TadB
MPFALAFMISLVDRSYLRPLWATSAGHLMIIIGLISMCFGGIVTRKIVNFKY